MQAVTITQITIHELETIIEETLKRILADYKTESLSKKNDEFLTIKEAAEYLKIVVPTIYGLVSRSSIPFMKRGKRLYFSKDELNKWIKTGKKRVVFEY
jgi:excisionase family DNA binding protein